MEPYQWAIIGTVFVFGMIPFVICLSILNHMFDLFFGGLKVHKTKAKK